MSFRKDRSLDELARVGNVAQFVSFSPIDGAPDQEFSRVAGFEANHSFLTNKEAHGRESRTVPIVFEAVSDPIGSGFVASLARPG